MRGMRSGLVTLAVATGFAICVVVGCSASGSGDDATIDTTPTDPMTPPPANAQLPAEKPAADDGDASKPVSKDAGKDAYVDAGPPPPVPGTPCPTVDQITKKKCGACGEQETLCLGSGDAGGGTWSTYSTCQGELAGGCTPGTIVNEACGNCGTRVKTCSQYCAFSTAACKGEPPASCVPSTVDLSAAGCATSGTYHVRSCSSTCTYGNFGLTCDAPPTTITAGPTLGSLSTTIVTLTQSQIATRLGGDCPTATLTGAATQTAYAYIKIHNPLASSITVSVWNSVAPGGVVFPTLLASYGAATPATDAARKACIQGVNDFGNDTLTGDDSFASLDDFYAVTIPASGTVTIYNAAQNKFSAANPALSTGNVKLTVRTETID